MYMENMRPHLLFTTAARLARSFLTPGKHIIGSKTRCNRSCGLDGGRQNSDVTSWRHLAAPHPQPRTDAAQRLERGAGESARQAMVSLILPRGHDGWTASGLALCVPVVLQVHP